MKGRNLNSFFLLLVLSVISSKAWAQYPVTWTNLVNVVQTGDTLTKTSGNGYNAGASSVNQLKAYEDGWVELVYGDIATSMYAIFGLSREDFGTDYRTVRYGFSMANGALQIYESGGLIGSYGALLATDTLRISRINDTIYYSRNGTVLSSQATDPSFELIVDLSISTYNKYVSNVTASFDTVLRVDPTVVDVLPTYDSTGSITLNIRGGYPPYSISWSNAASGTSNTSLTSGYYAYTVTDDSSNQIIDSAFVGYQVLWTNEYYIDSSNGNYIKANAATAWTIGASSKNYLAPGQDGWLEYTLFESAYFAIGLTPTDLTRHYETNRIYLQNSQRQVALKGTAGFGTGFFPIRMGDKVRMGRLNDTLYLSINDSVYYSAYQLSDIPLIIDVSLSSGAPAIHNIRTSIGTPFGVFFESVGQDPEQTNSGTITTDVRGGTPPYTYEWSDGGNTSIRTGLNAGHYSLTVIDNNSDSIVKRYELGYAIEWQNLTKMSDEGNDLVRNTTLTGYGGASTKNFIKAGENGKISAQLGYPGEWWTFGLTDSDTAISDEDINYCFTNVNGIILIEESGTTVYTHPQKMLVGDIFSIERIEDSIYYRINSNKIYYSSAADTSLTLLGDFFSTQSVNAFWNVWTNMGHLMDSTKLYWIGESSPPWTDPDNWSFYPANTGQTAIVPDSTTSIYLGPYSEFLCGLSEDAVINNFTIEFEGEDFISNHNLTVLNDVELLGDATMSLMSYSKLTIGGVLYLDSGYVDCSADTLTIGGGIIDTNGHIIHNNGTIHLSDVDSTEVFIASALHNLLISSSSGLVLNISSSVDSLYITDTSRIQLNNDLTITNHVTLDHAIIDGNGYEWIILDTSLSILSDSAGFICESTFPPEPLGLGVGENTGEYVFPLLTTEIESIPITVDVAYAGAGAGGQVQVLEIPMDTSKTLLTYAGFGTTNASGEENAQYIANRLWYNQFEDYDRNPVVNITLTYLEEDLEGTLISEDKIKAQCWNGYTWSSSKGTVDTSANTIVISGVNTDCAWIIVDSTSTMKSTLSLSIETVSYESPTNAGNAALVVHPVGGLAPYEIEWNNGFDQDSLTYVLPGTYYVTVTDALDSVVTDSVEIGYEIIWKDLVNIFEYEFGLQKDTGQYSWNASAKSRNYLPKSASGKIVNLIDQYPTTVYALGFSNAFDTTDIENGFFFTGDTLTVFENDSAYLSATGLSLGDQVSIDKVEDSVFYYWNDSLLRVGVADTTLPLFVDCAIYTPNGKTGTIYTTFNSLSDSMVLYWTGDQDSTWDNPSNWSFTPCGSPADTIPDESTHIVFTGCANDPAYIDTSVTVWAATYNDGYSYLVNTDTFTLTVLTKITIDGADIILNEDLSLNNNLELTNGSFSLSGYDLSITGKLTMLGDTLKLDTGTVFISDSLILSGGYIDCDTATLTIGESLVLVGGAFVGDSATISVNGDLNLEYGFFESTAHQLTIQGDFIDVNGFYNANGGLVVLNDTSTLQTKATLHELKLTSGSVIDLQADLSANDSLIVEGVMELNGYDLNILNSGPGIFVASAGELRAEGEGFDSKVLWHVGTQTGTFAIPFTNDAGDDLRLSAFIDTPGVGDGVIVFSTYPTDTLLDPLPSAVLDLYGPDDTTEYDFIVQRYWLVEYLDFDTIPSVTLTINYTDNDYDTGVLDPSYLKVQRWTGYGWSNRIGTVNTSLKTLTVPSYKGGGLVVISTQADPLYSFRVDDYAALSRKLNGSYFIANDGLNFKYDEAYNEGDLEYAIYDQSHTLVFGSSLGHDIPKNYGDNRMFIRCHCYPSIFTDGEFYTLIVTNEKGEDFMLRFRYFYQESCIQYGGDNQGLISGGQ